MAAGMWGRAVPPDRDPGALRAALMTMSAVAWAARWAASGRTLNGGQHDAGMSELVGDDLQLRALQHQRRRAVPKIMEPDRRQARALDQPAEGDGQVVRAQRPAPGPGNTYRLGGTPFARAYSS
jgi:hypothetical protein